MTTIRRPNGSKSLHQGTLANGAAVLVSAAVLGGGCSGKKPPSETGGAAELTAIKVDKLPLTEPGAKAWADSPEVILQLMPQGVAFPMLQEVKIPHMKVRVLRNKAWIAFRLEWEDKTQSDMLDVDKFTDGVAIELPLGNPDKTNPMMGSKEDPVYVAHWKAVWQRDTDQGRADVQDYHPNFWADPYPFVTSGHPYPVVESFQSANQRRYLPGVAAGNPVSSLARRQPVEELQAEGFSTLADHRVQEAQAKGVWKDGVWRVVIAIPLSSGDHANPKFTIGGKQKVAFAVWDGGASNVAGRKQWHPFVTLNVP